ncbi:hypothetical protein BT96DRAFT_973358 [Gymnopus androsaceus JB14]|uniref:Thioesterase domain-containing protein n=1 Tax=Gymnopus androsaceus JB14 TaxID=1447944 RepID=A0A6A4I090_9AGAR|nr:hypothetical protein BT96DRAFT_973358 [Gymnopus androsaceus JB14]
MASNNRSQDSQQHEQWPSDASAFPIIPPDTTTSQISPSSISTTNVSEIRGNVSDASKRFVMDIFAYYIGAKEESFGVEVGRRLKMQSMNVWSSNTTTRRRVEAQTVFDITVTADMCNPMGTLHGACACYIVDPCSMSAIVVLGAALGIDATGVSQSMNLIWHKPAKMGTKLHVLSTSVFIEGRVRTARVEIFDSETDQLYVSAIHSTMHSGSKSEQEAYYVRSYSSVPWDRPRIRAIGLWRSYL